jgi:hypothetical protein
MRFGYQPQTIEVAGISLGNYKRSVALKDLPHTTARYAGWEETAPWRKAAAERIETLRKGELHIEVVDANGRPVPDAQVSVRMRRHEFAFGTAVQASRLAAPAGPDDERYRQTVEQYFNKVVFENDLKWYRWGTNSVAGREHRRQTLAAIDWLRARQIAIRGHVMVWPSWENTPEFLRPLGAEPAKLRETIDHHIADQTATLKGRLDEWDVVNESYANNDILKILGRGEMPRWFQLAHQGDLVIVRLADHHVPGRRVGEQRAPAEQRLVAAPRAIEVAGHRPDRAGQLQRRVGAQRVQIVGVFVATGDGEHSLPQHLAERMLYLGLLPSVGDASAHRFRQADPAVCLADQHQARVRSQVPSVKSGVDLLAADRRKGQVQAGIVHWELLCLVLDSSPTISTECAPFLRLTHNPG